MSKRCVKQLLAFIEEHPDEATFQRDLKGALEKYAAELPCQPQAADIRALQSALRAAGIRAMLDEKASQRDYSRDPKRRKDGAGRLPGRASISRGRLDDWDEMADGGRLDDWDD